MPLFVPYCLLSGRSISNLRARFGVFIPGHSWQHRKRIWFHAASVGEVQAAVALISALQHLEIQADIIITTVTEQGLLAAKRQYDGKVFCLLAPLDLPWVIERFIQKIKPSVYICLETELWPNMLRLAKAHGIKSLLLNGRLSARSFQTYKRFMTFMGQVLRCFDSASVIQAIDRERYIALGFDPTKIEVRGNVKYDLRPDPLVADVKDCPEQTGTTLQERVIRHYQEVLSLEQSQPVLLAGSTHSGEEGMMIAAYEELVAIIPNLVLIIAPRHLDRLSHLKADWQRQGVSCQTFSQVVAEHRTARIVIVDKMGELTKLYAVATYVFCGGSLAPRGGHNIMEPAIWGKSPFYGPHMNDFLDARTLLESNEAGFTINSGQELVEKIAYFHQHQDKYQQAGQRALAVALAQQGSALKQAEMIVQALGQ